MKSFPVKLSCRRYAVQVSTQRCCLGTQMHAPKKFYCEKNVISYLIFTTNYTAKYFSNIIAVLAKIQTCIKTIIFARN